jgi:excisionase family DNA binding protein
MSAPSTTTSPLIDRRAVAELLGISAGSVDNLVRRGEFPRPLRVGKLIKFNRAAVLAWIDRGGSTPAS